MIFVSFLCDFLQSTLERKKKNFSFTRKFPFMKSKDERGEEGSEGECEWCTNFLLLHNFQHVPNIYLSLMMIPKLFSTLLSLDL